MSTIPPSPVDDLPPHPPPFGELTSEEKTLGMLCHLLAFCGYVVPFGNILGPLIIWLVKKDSSPFVDDQGKESLNFQITVLIAIIICIPLLFICIGGILMGGIVIAELILVIIASVNAASGTPFRYPLTFRFIK